MDASQKILSDLTVYMKYAKFLPEYNSHLLERNVEEFSTVIEILHMSISGIVVLVIQAVFTPVKFKRFEPELLAQFNVKGRGCFDPPPVEVQGRVTVKIENIGAHSGSQAFG